MGCMKIIIFLVNGTILINHKGEAIETKRHFACLSTNTQHLCTKYHHSVFWRQRRLLDLKLPFHSEEAKEKFSAHCIHCWSAGLSSKEINCRRDASNLVLLHMIIWYDVNEQESKILYDSELVVVTWRGGGKEPGAPCDGVALYLVTARKLLPRGRRHHRHRHAVSPSPGVCPGPGHQQQRVRLSLLLNTDDQANGQTWSDMIRHYHQTFLWWSSGKAWLVKLPRLALLFWTRDRCCSSLEPGAG